MALDPRFEEDPPPKLRLVSAEEEAYLEELKARQALGND